MNKIKQYTTKKSVETSAVTEEQIARINRYTRRALVSDEVFVFSVVLCDNEIDRDGERFPLKSLDTLAELFAGKTGIFDHRATSENQAARIFQTELVKDQEREAYGEPYAQLKAWAYMVRCEKNADLILEIDAGIKKEVSVGCAVEQVVCSVCGADQKKEPCVHRKGESYGGIECHYMLCNPTDAYEWSFVAVPAQKNAGVTKGLDFAAESSGILQKIKSAKGNITLTDAEAEAFTRQMGYLTELARFGGEYREELEREVVRLAALSQPGLSPTVLEKVCGRMELSELKAFRKGFQATAARLVPTPQLVPSVPSGPSDADIQFKV